MRMVVIPALVVSNTLLRVALMADTGTYKLIETTVVPHKEGTVDMEQFALQGLGHEIGSHLFGRTIHHPKVALVDLVMDEKETNVKGTSSLTRAALAILSKNDG